MIILNPRIHTLCLEHTCPENPWGTVEAIQTDHTGVVFSGSRSAALARRRDGEAVLNIDAGCVIPGIIDTHAHTTGLTMRPGALTLPDETSPMELARAVAAAASAVPAGTWITGRAWNQAVWSPAELASSTPSPEGFPHHGLLSAAAPHHPVILHRTDQHAAWVNESAMRAAGLSVDGTLVSPPGGEVVSGPDGRPWGVFLDEAVGFITDAMPGLTRAENRSLLREKGQSFLSRGVTCVHCALIRPEELEDYGATLGADGLRLRIRGMVYDKPDALAQWAERTQPSRDPEGWWSFETLKAFADGALGSRGAWFYEDYEGVDQRGISVSSPAAIEGLSRAAIANGWQMATHAIGSRAISETVAAYVRAGWTRAHSDRLRWRVEHVQHPLAKTLDKMAELGLYGTMQPIHATRDMRFVASLIGPERASSSYPWRGLLARGIPLGFGSDYPIETLDPFEGMHAAITRQDAAGHPQGGWHPQHRVTALEAVMAYTRSAASFTAGDCGRLGHLGEGAAADFVALDVDPSRDSAETIRDASVLSVYTGNQPVIP